MISAGKAIGLAIAAAFLFGCGWIAQGWRKDAAIAGMHASDDRDRRAAAEATLELERETRRAFDAVALNHRKENELAKANIDRLRADVRSGALRLSVAVDSCPAAAAGTGHPETRAELLPAAAERILDIAADADGTVRDLNECVDKYNAVKMANNQ